MCCSFKAVYSGHLRRIVSISFLVDIMSPLTATVDRAVCFSDHILCTLDDRQRSLLNQLNPLSVSVDSDTLRRFICNAEETIRIHPSLAEVIYFIE